MGELAWDAWLVIVLALVAGGLTKGLTGLGLPGIAVPIMAIFLGVETAVMVMVLPTLATNLWLDASAPLVVRIGTASLAAGFSLMLMSLVRERIRTWRHDPYKEVASERPWSCSSRPRSWRSARR